MYAGYCVDSITNGVHAETWTCQPVQQLFDQYIPGWQLDNLSLRGALNIPVEPIHKAHQLAKKNLLNHINQLPGATSEKHMEEDIFTIGFARRSTLYKRPDLFFTDLKRLQAIGEKFVRLQIIYAGKAHPNDNQGKLLIQKIISIAKSLNKHINIIYLNNYDIALAN